MTALFYPNASSIPISLIIPDCLNVQSGFCVENYIFTINFSKYELWLT